MTINADLAGHKPPNGPSAPLWISGTIVVIAAWFAVYEQLAPFAQWAMSLTPLPPGEHAYEALKFFLYDTPKVLMLLVLVVFAMGAIRSFDPGGTTRRRRQCRGRLPRRLHAFLLLLRRAAVRGLCVDGRTAGRHVLLPDRSADDQ
jgi:hypothetical protein